MIGVGRIRFRRKRQAQFFDRIGGIVFPDILGGRFHVGVCIGAPVLRLGEFFGLLDFGSGALKITGASQQLGEDLVGRGILRIEIDRPLDFPNRILGLDLAKCQAELPAELGIRRIELAGFFVFRKGLGSSPPSGKVFPPGRNAPPPIREIRLCLCGARRRLHLTLPARFKP